MEGFSAGYSSPVPDDQTAVDQMFMDAALAEASASRRQGGVPVGAVLADCNGVTLGSGYNERVQKSDATAHGEISCLRNAGRRASYAGLTLYTTLAPCHMCTGAVLLFQIPRLVIGENANFVGDIPRLLSSGVEVRVLNDAACIQLMKDFIRLEPQLWAEDISDQSGQRSEGEFGGSL